MKSPIIVTILLVLAAPAFASPRPVTATAAQWKDIHTLHYAFGSCGGYADDPEHKDACDLSDRLQKKLEKQGFCFYKHLVVGRLAWHGPEEDRAKLWPEGGKQCYTLHDPAP